MTKFFRVTVRHEWVIVVEAESAEEAEVVPAAVEGDTPLRYAEVHEEMSAEEVEEGAFPVYNTACERIDDDEEADVSDCLDCPDSTDAIVEMHKLEGVHPSCGGCGAPLLDGWYQWNTPGSDPRVCSEKCYTQVTGDPYKESYRWDGGDDDEAEEGGDD